MVHDKDNAVLNKLDAQDSEDTRSSVYYQSRPAMKGLGSLVFGIKVTLLTCAKCFILSKIANPKGTQSIFAGGIVLTE